MITRIEVASSQPGVPELPLGGFMPIVDPVHIRNIDGLGPVKSDIVSSMFATGRGELYQGSSTGKRNIVFTMGLNPNWEDQTMSSLRQLLYKYFMPESWAKFRFHTDELPTAFINGIIESFEPNLFALDPEIQVSVLCPKPDFIDVDTTLIYGTVDNDIDNIINYTGTAPAGFELRLYASDALASYTGDVSIINTTRGEIQKFTINDLTVNSGLYFKMNTVRASRQAYSVINEVDNVQSVNILSKIDRNSTWLELLPGENVLSFVTNTPGLTWGLGYFNRFGGL